MGDRYGNPLAVGDRVTLDWYEPVPHVTTRKTATVEQPGDAMTVVRFDKPFTSESRQRGRNAERWETCRVCNSELAKVGGEPPERIETASEYLKRMEAT